MKDRLVAWLVPRPITMFYYLLAHSTRWTWVDSPVRAGTKQQAIVCFWHARMLMIPKSIPDWDGYMLISSHRDGAFIADTMHLIGIRTVRGSTTRGGARAMLEMIRKARRLGCDLGITPDGPRGPREVVQPGTVQLAIKTGLPLLPVCYATKRHWRAGSWDWFYIPSPFTCGVFVFGDYVFIDRDEDLESARLRAQAAMDDTQRRADTYFDKQDQTSSGEPGKEP